MSEPKRFPDRPHRMHDGRHMHTPPRRLSHAAFGDGTATFVTLNIEGPLALECVPPSRLLSSSPIRFSSSRPCKHWKHSSVYWRRCRSMRAATSAPCASYGSTARTCLVCAFAFAPYALYDNLAASPAGSARFHSPSSPRMVPPAGRKGGGKALDRACGIWVCDGACSCS